MMDYGLMLVKWSIDAIQFVRTHQNLQKLEKVYVFMKRENDHSN